GDAASVARGGLEEESAAIRSAMGERANRPLDSRPRVVSRQAADQSRDAAHRDTRAELLAIARRRVRGYACGRTMSAPAADGRFDWIDEMTDAECMEVFWLY